MISMRGSAPGILIDSGAEISVTSTKDILHHYRDYGPSFSTTGFLKGGSLSKPLGFGYIVVDLTVCI